LLSLTSACTEASNNPSRKNTVPKPQQAQTRADQPPLKLSRGAGPRARSLCGAAGLATITLGSALASETFAIAIAQSVSSANFSAGFGFALRAGAAFFGQLLWRRDRTHDLGRLTFAHTLRAARLTLPVRLARLAQAFCHLLLARALSFLLALDALRRVGRPHGRQPHRAQQ
jgi:hypothetical protein